MLMPRALLNMSSDSSARTPMSINDRLLTEHTTGSKMNRRDSTIRRAESVIALLGSLITL